MQEKKGIFTAIIVVILVVLIAMPTLALAKHGGRACQCKSTQMKPADALIWTFFNPTECKMSFLSFSDRVSGYVSEIKKEEIKKNVIINELLRKHVASLVLELQNGKDSYYEASNYEGYVKMIKAYKDLGIECELDNFTLDTILRERYKQKCEELLKELRHGNMQEKEAHLIELKGLLKKSSFALMEIGTSEEEMKAFVNPSIPWRIKWALRM